MTADEYLKAERLDEALASLLGEVRQKPAEARPRIFLFQLLCVLGQWERAATQLQVLGEMDADCVLMAHIFRPVLQCEALRGEVFAGKRTPIIFGEPEEWMGWLVQANCLIAQGQFPAARQLRDQAFEAAPATPGRLNGTQFEWISDADSRLGPMLEAIVESRYWWVPFSRVKRIELAAPADLRDLVWMPARFVWNNGGEASGLIPTRYPGTEGFTDAALRLARKTEWVPKEGEFYMGIGQRMLTTDQTETPLGEVRTIELG
ncbi:MAG: type VI secretion system accessory protein TagJ [Verrucomicrobiia bacterium]